MRLAGLPKEGEELFQSFLANELNAHGAGGGSVVLMTTLRYDPDLKHLTRRVPIAMEDSDDDVFFLSKLHHRRLKYGAGLLGWQDVQISHTTMVTKMNEVVSHNGREHPQRVKITVDSKGKMDVSASVVPERDDLFSGLSTSAPKEASLDPVFRVTISKSEHPAQVANMIKTTDRREYDALRAPLGAPVAEPQEVLLVGSHGEILEGTMTSVAFKRNNEWITPRLDNGGMVGTTRSLLLGLKFVREGRIQASEISDGERVLLFNGVQGVVAGFVAL